MLFVALLPLTLVMCVVSSLVAGWRVFRPLVANMTVFLLDNATVAMTGGAGVTLCPLGGAAPKGGRWSPDGWIIYGTDDPATGLWRVPASGGEPELLTTPVREQGDHWWPQ